MVLFCRKRNEAGSSAIDYNCCCSFLGGLALATLLAMAVAIPCIFILSTGNSLSHF
jgi:hypothetical protein